MADYITTSSRQSGDQRATLAKDRYGRRCVDLRFFKIVDRDTGFMKPTASGLPVYPEDIDSTVNALLEMKKRIKAAS